MADNPLSAHDANYASVWARDGVITGLWTLCLEDPELLKAFERTLRLLAKHQAPSGQIPSNVRVAGERPDYSGIRPRLHGPGVGAYGHGPWDPTLHGDDRRTPSRVVTGAASGVVAHGAARRVRWRSCSQ